MKISEPPVVVSQSFSASPSEVWAAITELDQMHQWFFEEIPSFRAEVGFRTNFEIQNEGRSFPHHWEVLEVTPERKIVYNWNYPNYPGDSNVHFDIKTKTDGTILTVTCEILEDYPDEIPEFKRESCLGGWTYFINERLKGYMDSKG